MKLLPLLLKNIFSLSEFPEIDIHNISLDSRQVKPGDLFFAYPGNKFDGREFIHDAIKKGAVAVLADTSDEEKIVWEENIPIIYIVDLENKMSEIVSRFYDDPSKKMLVIGVTGTNGKTSICHLLGHALTKLNRKVGVLGTIGHGLLGQLSAPTLTTPDPITIQKVIYECYQQHADTIVMEASSHALDQGRVNGVAFDLGIYTNLTRDHLDYHGDMTLYEAAKHRLFEMNNLKQAVFNLDDPIGLKWAHEFKNKLTICGVSLNKQEKDFATVFVTDLNLHHHGIQANVVTPWGSGELTTSLLGRFNVSNLLCVVASLGLLGYPLVSLLNVISKLKTVPGRMQKVGNQEHPLVVVDFAHTPDALEKALMTLKEHCSGKLICVFGCGGDRDRGKRPIMASITEQYADRIYLTDDNVRCENPEKIFQDIEMGFKNNSEVIKEHDRAIAIKNAIESAEKNDVILIAGKGHEAYQIIGTEKFPFDDVLIAQKCLKK